MPDEILLIVIHELDKKSYFNAMHTCHRFYELCGDEVTLSKHIREQYGGDYQAKDYPQLLRRSLEFFDINVKNCGKVERSKCRFDIQDIESQLNAFSPCRDSGDGSMLMASVTHINLESYHPSSVLAIELFKQKDGECLKKAKEYAIEINLEFGVDLITFTKHGKHVVIIADHALIIRYDWRLNILLPVCEMYTFISAFETTPDLDVFLIKTADGRGRVYLVDLTKNKESNMFQLPFSSEHGSLIEIISDKLILDNAVIGSQSRKNTGESWSDYILRISQHDVVMRSEAKVEEEGDGNLLYPLPNNNNNGYLKLNRDTQTASLKTVRLTPPRSLTGKTFSFPLDNMATISFSDDVSAEEKCNNKVTPIFNSRDRQINIQVDNNKNLAEKETSMPSDYKEIDDMIEPLDTIEIGSEVVIGISNGLERCFCLQHNDLYITSLKSIDIDNPVKAVRHLKLSTTPTSAIQWVDSSKIAYLDNENNLCEISITSAQPTT